MGTYRQQDPLAEFLTREQERVLSSIDAFSSGAGAASLAEAERVLMALASAETNVLYPAFTRVSLRLEMQCLLDDSRGNRAQQLAGLETLAHKRAPRLRKLAAVELADQIRQHGESHMSLLIPVLGSQLPRPLYRSIVQAFLTHYQGELETQEAAAPCPHATRRGRRVAVSA